jgi:hypothetical protein
MRDAHPGGRALNALLKLLGELATAESITLRDPGITFSRKPASLPSPICESIRHSILARQEIAVAWRMSGRRT